MPDEVDATPGSASAPGFPGTVTEVLHLLVTADLERSRAFYTDILGAQVRREMEGVLAFLDLAGARIVLTVGGEGTADKPQVRLTPPTDPGTAHSEVILRVTDTRAVHDALVARGAQFLTPPVDFGWEVRCYLTDPDGHLIEITQPGSGPGAAPPT